MRQPLEDTSSPCFLRPAFWEAVQRDVLRLDPAEVLAFERAGELPLELRASFESELWGRLQTKLGASSAAGPKGRC